MKSVFAFIIPAILAVVAGGLNYLALRGESYDYVTTKTQLSAGDTFSESKIAKVTVRGKMHGAISWEDRDVLLAVACPRDMEEGEFVLRQDIPASATRTLSLEDNQVAVNISLAGVEYEHRLIRVGQKVGFVIGRAEDKENERSGDPMGTSGGSQRDYRIVGPFVVVTLGEKVVDEANQDAEGGDRPATLSIAVNKSAGVDVPLDGELQALLEANQNRRIAAVVLYPSTTTL